MTNYLIIAIASALCIIIWIIAQTNRYIAALRKTNDIKRGIEELHEKSIRRALWGINRIAEEEFRRACRSLQPDIDELSGCWVGTNKSRAHHIVKGFYSMPDFIYEKWKRLIDVTDQEFEKHITEALEVLEQEILAEVIPVIQFYASARVCTIESIDGLRIPVYAGERARTLLTKLKEWDGER